MRGREQFGKYLLLKKLSEDPLGETFRAGRVSGSSVDQVVLLRVFNGRGLDGERLWQRISGRRGVQEALKNPNIGNGVELGEERGVPYVAYDYVSGRNLESLLIQASNTNSPVPVDHALLIAERMALGLAAAAETRGPEGRIHHGFAVPHLVMVSNEGETRVLGFEAAPGLTEQAGSLGAEMTRYLAPEVVGGQAVEPADDVYTLGAVLWELLACKPLPKSTATNPAAAIDGAQVAYDGTPYPPEVAALLKRSLAPRGQRIVSAADWHKSLTQLMANAGYTATTFNLAFFMHNLFRNEIEAENREIEAEKNISLEDESVVAAAPVAAVVSDDPLEATADRTADEVEKSSGKGLWLALAAVLLLALVGGGWWYMSQQKAAEEQAAAEEAAAAAAAAEAAAEPEEPAGPSPEEIQAQISAMLDERSAEMQEKLGSQYDQQLRELQSQLAEAQSAASAAEEERQRKINEEKQRAEAEAARIAAEEQAQREAQAEAARKAEEDRKAKEAERLAQQQEEEAQEAAAPPPKPATKEGDLVGMGDGVTPPQLIAQPQARYPAMARKLGKEADVEVRVLVDERGNVREADPVGGKAGFGFDAAALEAARSAKYRPAMKDGVRVKMYVNLTIKFSL